MSKEKKSPDEGAKDTISRFHAPGQSVNFSQKERKKGSDSWQWTCTMTEPCTGYLYEQGFFSATVRYMCAL